MAPTGSVLSWIASELVPARKQDSLEDADKVGLDYRSIVLPPKSLKSFKFFKKKRAFKALQKILTDLGNPGIADQVREVTITGDLDNLWMLWNEPEWRKFQLHPVMRQLQSQDSESCERYRSRKHQEKRLCARIAALQIHAVFQNLSSVDSLIIDGIGEEVSITAQLLANDLLCCSSIRHLHYRWLLGFSDAWRPLNSSPLTCSPNSSLTIIFDGTGPRIEGMDMTSKLSHDSILLALDDADSRSTKKLDSLTIIVKDTEQPRLRNVILQTFVTMRIFFNLKAFHLRSLTSNFGNGSGGPGSALRGFVKRQVRRRCLRCITLSPDWLLRDSPDTTCCGFLQKMESEKWVFELKNPVRVNGETRSECLKCDVWVDADIQLLKPLENRILSGEAYSLPILANAEFSHIIDNLKEAPTSLYAYKERLCFRPRRLTCKVLDLDSEIFEALRHWVESLKEVNLVTRPQSILPLQSYLIQTHSFVVDPTMEVEFSIMGHIMPRWECIQFNIELDPSLSTITPGDQAHMKEQENILAKLLREGWVDADLWVRGMPYIIVRITRY